MKQPARTGPAPSRIWVIDGGEVTPRFPTHLDDPTTVICADNGLTHALAAGLTPDVLVGDLDSVPPQTVERWLRDNPTATLKRHATDKDHSDLDLALSLAVAHQPDELVVVSGGSGRVDHLIVGMLALTQPHVCAHSPTAYIGDAVALPITAHQTRTLPSPPTPAHVTLIAVGGAARLTTTGLRWNLQVSQELAAGSTRGLSNEPLGTDPPQVAVTHGTVLALIVPANLS